MPQILLVANDCQQGIVNANGQKFQLDTIAHEQSRYFAGYPAHQIVFLDNYQTVIMTGDFKNS
jgi:hypothetical protein